MGLFHRHSWEEYARTYAPPALEAGIKLTGATAQTVAQICMGATTFLFRCNKVLPYHGVCGATRVNVCIGKVEKP